jgi:four helix bundle protein
MAQTEHLPIYKRAYDLCLYLEQVVRNFSRYHKYSLGQDLRDGARRVLRLVVRANSRRDKTPVLHALREEVEELKVLLRLCHDAKAFANFNSFEHAITQVTDIARQNEGWLKSQQQGRGPTGAGPTGAGQNRPVISAGAAGPSVP